MSGSKVITLPCCSTTEDVLAIRRSYLGCCHSSEKLVVDLALLDPEMPNKLLLGVLLNLHHYVGNRLPIYLKDYPDYLPVVLKLCRLEHMFQPTLECDS